MKNRGDAPITPVVKAPSTPPKKVDVASIWADGSPADTDPYVSAKRIDPTDLRVLPNGLLAVPLRSLAGELHSLQQIDAKGGKKNLAGCNLADSMFLIGAIAANGRVFVVEGIATGNAVARADIHAAVAVTVGVGRFATVARAIRSQYPGAQIILVPDRGQEQRAEKIACEVRGAWIVMSDDAPRNYDAYDFEVQHSTEALAQLLLNVKVPALRYCVLSGCEIAARPTKDDLIDGVVPADAVGLIWGGIGVSKSFFVLEMAARLAEGREFFGRTTRRVVVTYLVLEGHAGISRRILAWQVANKRLFPSNVHFIEQPFSLHARQDIDDLCTAMQAVGAKDGVLFIDTLARATSGADENSSQDASLTIKAMSELRDRIGGTVIAIHHSGKNLDAGPRGHSSIAAAVDFHLHVLKVKGSREWRTGKQKDGPDDIAHLFALDPVEVGTKGNGLPLTSCVIRPVFEKVLANRPAMPKGMTQIAVYEAIKKMLIVSPDFGKGHSPVDRPCVQLQKVVLVAGATLACEPKLRKTLVGRAIQAMAKNGVYVIEDDWLREK
ncbi:AAA family ATPase [Caballeronia sp.]|uniref:AAA family ATPase n=1 Tax=Caballeronia sp. TaxID=1931223 RepID=UPI003C4E4D40